MRKALLLLALSFAIVPLQAADSAAVFDVQKILGIYKGQALNGGGLEPVETSFTVGREGELQGGYVLNGEQRTFRGHLSNAQFESARRVSMEWTDKDGEGQAFFEFSSDYRSFTGQWTDSNGAGGPWNGKKQ